MTDKYDAIVVGGGHNGLVCSTLLAQSGKQVLLLEANSDVGGAAITRKFADGYSVSACAHLLYNLQPSVIKDLKLNPALASQDMTTIALDDGGEHVRIKGDLVTGARSGDDATYKAFHKRMTRFADLLRTYFNRTPPRLGSGDLSDMTTLGRLALDVRMLGKKEMEAFLRLIGMNIYDEVLERL